MFEAMARECPSEQINSTTPQYGPMLYTIGRAIPAYNVLEIGVAQGWSSGFMAYAVHENNIRFGMKGKYWGLDVDKKDYLQSQHDEKGLPSNFIEHRQGSVHFLEHRELWPQEWRDADVNGLFDLIFIDGLHEAAYVRQEIKLLTPLLKGNGNGYLCNHDVYSFMEGLWPEIVAQEAPDAKGIMRPRWEHIRFLENYGFGIMRNMQGYDHEKVFWPSGDQRDLAINAGFLTPSGELIKEPQK